MRATAIEFRFRFLIITLVFVACFWLSRLQHHSLWPLLTQWLASFDRLSTDANANLIGGVATAFAVAGAALRTWGTAYLNPAVVHDAQLHSHRVVASGPFAHLRNPLYLGTMLTALAVAPILAPWYAAAELLFLVLFTLRLIRREEWQMAESQGEVYLAYKRAVPSLLPALRRSAQPEGGADARPRWMQGFLGELWAWGLAVAVGIYSATFRFDLFLQAVAVSLGIYLVAKGLMPRAGQPGAAQA